MRVNGAPAKQPERHRTGNIVAREKPLGPAKYPVKLMGDAPLSRRHLSQFCFQNAAPLRSQVALDVSAQVFDAVN